MIDREAIHQLRTAYDADFSGMGDLVRRVCDIALQTEGRVNEMFQVDESGKVSLLVPQQRIVLSENDWRRVITLALLMAEPHGSFENAVANADNLLARFHDRETQP